ncbi:dipeptidyl aminopeptidase BI [Candidatus Phycosocius bacilliformis]|uniref:Dipeptidyl aminopeptidase BI n=1 Tax=Candidatus Phycosocius bacilliformis TaxID=1445552 RepID=A0A2P2E6X0_9PROT|nr:S9 family peptidase [Candidatus Phycosocius bacilliformis]GBF56798.1 dipeptidyl aminopeptidase BI [Candidatus Phycosocius bacilliformis]
MQQAIDRRAILLAGAAMTASTALPAFAQSSSPRRGAPQGPVARKVAHEITQHGQKRVDNYHWLRDPNWQAVIDEPTKLSEEIRVHIEAENAYTKSVLLDPTAKLRADLFEELKGKIKQDDSSVPARDGDWAYAIRFRAGGQYPIVYRRSIDAVTGQPTGPEQILIDGDKESKGEKFWRLQDWAQNPAQDILAYFVDYEGGNKVTLRFRAMATGSDLPYKIEGASAGLVWAKDGRTCFYCLLDDNFRVARVMRHIVGEDPKTDVLVFEEKDPSFQSGIVKSSSGDYMIIYRSQSESTDILTVPLAKPTSKPKRFTAFRQGVEYFPDHHGGHFYIRTNAGGAIDFKIARTPVNKTAAANWTDFIPHEAGRFIENVNLYAGHMVLEETVDALPRLTVRDMTSGDTHQIAFPEEAYDLSVLRGFEWNTKILRFTYNSPSTPTETWDYDLVSRERSLRKTQEIPSGHNKADYVVRRTIAVATDGARIPLTILYHKNTPIDGTAPALLYGYGSYGISMPASFSTARLPLVDRGMVYCIAHIRGGQERGYQWYLDGKLMKKQNTFSDFARAAEALVEQKFAAPKKIVIEGRSAGGLLVGAVMNQRPELFAGVIGGVAFVDVINTISDGELPLTPPEWTEWGNPITSKEAFDYMMAYSPYDQVGTKPYPPLFAQTALSDSQVTYWEPTKWVAKLRELSPDAGPFLLDVNMSAGHGGASGRFDRLKEVADSHAFALWCVGKA